MSKPDYSKIRPLKVTVITDIHYYSKTLGTDGGAYMKHEGCSQKLSRESAEVIREAWDLICEDDEAQTVLIHGDLTANGDFASHDEVLNVLRELQARGKKVIVSYSTHDYRKPTDGMQYAQSYDGDAVIRVPCYTESDIEGRFDEFGRGEAISRCPVTDSYAVQLSDGIRLLALNDDLRGRIGSGYLPEQIEWIKEQVEDARSHGQYIFAMAHHPVLPAAPIFYVIGKKFDIVQDYKKIYGQFADMGLNLLFTGHTHNQNISYEYSDLGNIFYDVSTASLVGYPPAMRKVTIDPANDVVRVSSLIIQGCKYFDTEGLTLPLFIRRNFFGMMDEFVASGASGDIERFTKIADSFSIKAHTVKKVRFLIKPVFKYLSGLTMKKIAKWTEKETGLKKDDYADIADERLVPFFIEVVARMYAGDPDCAPDTARYKIIMAFAAVIDDIIRYLPFNLKKSTGYSSVSEIADPMIYNGGICDDHADIIIDNDKASQILPKRNSYAPPYRSKKGLIIVAAAMLGALLLSPVWLPGIFIAGVILFFRKIIRRIKK
ncbi:MAG: metallophosphoesterase [Clostridiales bacterium]|jgi:hypothetical protein|nr:metallophosphoesterase [Clostridiales bacterium]